MISLADCRHWGCPTCPPLQKGGQKGQEGQEGPRTFSSLDTRNSETVLAELSDSRLAHPETFREFLYSTLSWKMMHLILSWSDSLNKWSSNVFVSLYSCTVLYCTVLYCEPLLTYSPGKLDVSNVWIGSQKIWMSSWRALALLEVLAVKISFYSRENV